MIRLTTRRPVGVARRVYEASTRITNLAEISVSFGRDSVLGIQSGGVNT